ncbi:hypothetical protein C8J57DRAFT_1665008 [Mycena rebaudengoi]|nr:hypothetical protein C8J57DRAFT_1665008 [Mycena rebaudengoi]
MESWLTSLEPHSGATDEDKAKTLMSVAFAKPFDPSDKDVVNDTQALLDTVAGKTPAQRSISATRNSSSLPAMSFCGTHALHSSPPRSQCQNQGGQNCCISWSTYKVQAGFFSTTWTTCNQEVNYDGDSSASCEGKSSTQGGDVCLSNRATGCT